MEKEKTWGFDYYTYEEMDKVNPDYNKEIDVYFEVCDPETFTSKSSDFKEACKEFDEFILEFGSSRIWDIDPEASFNFGEKYRSIIDEINWTF